MKKELTKLEKRLLYNFVIGESNRILFPNIDGLSQFQNNLSIEIKIKPSTVNLNNFNSDIEKYKKALSKLIKKLN